MKTSWETLQLSYWFVYQKFWEVFNGFSFAVTKQVFKLNVWFKIYDNILPLRMGSVKGIQNNGVQIKVCRQMQVKKTFICLVTKFTAEFLSNCLNIIGLFTKKKKKIAIHWSKLTLWLVNFITNGLYGLKCFKLVLVLFLSLCTNLSNRLGTIFSYEIYFLLLCLNFHNSLHTFF